MNERPGPGALVTTGFALGMLAGGVGAIGLAVLLFLNEADLGIMKALGPALIFGCALTMAAVNLGRYQFVLLQNMMPPQRDPDLPEYVDQRAEHEEAYEGSFEEVPVDPPCARSRLAIEIARCALQQIVWRYNGENPTREAFTRREQVSQPIWNSGRDVLKVIGMVSETKVWADVDRTTAMQLFDRVTCEEGKIWVPILGKTGQFKWINVRPQLVDNRHTVVPPHSLGR